MHARHISTTITRSSVEVYDFVSDPRNLPKWASGLSSGSVARDGDTWIAQSPMGVVKIKFAPKNNFGVVDHEVTLASGVKVSNPMRIITNDEGCEVVFTLFRQLDMTDAKFEEDANWVTRDLQRLKDLLEHNSSAS